MSPKDGVAYISKIHTHKSMLFGPTIMANTMTIASYSVKRPMMKLLASNATNPLYHLVFARRVCRVSSLLIQDSVNCGDVIQECTEDLNFTNVDCLSVYCLSCVLFTFCVFSGWAFNVQHPFQVSRKTHQDTNST